MKTELRKLLKAFRMEAAVYRAVLNDRRCPKLARWLLRAAVGYALSPVDLIPDFIPIVGQLDDVLLLPLLVWTALRMVPKELVAEHRCREKISKRYPGTGAVHPFDGN